MAAIDIVTANEFTFTPSAFIAAYIEQTTSTTVSETTSNGGKLETVPLQIENLQGSTDTTVENVSLGPSTGAITTDIATNGIFAYRNPQGYAQVTGSFIELVGQEVADSRTATKTVTTTQGVANTVVLVLSYGSYKAKCVDAQATVNLIFQRVSDYLSSL